MFGRKIHLFNLMGFDVSLDASWFILAVLITWTLAKGLFPHYYEDLTPGEYWAMGAAGAVGLFFSIVVHEFCHSLVARSNGLPMKGITLFIFGGVAEMDEEPPSPGAEFRMAVAGPAASIAIGAILFGIEWTGVTEAGGVPVTGVVSYLAYLNLVLAGFNLVPAFPLDGGRVLRSLLWGWKGNLRWATDIAAQVGSGFGAALIVLAVFTLLGGNLIGGVWWFLIGMFIRGASRMSYQRVLMRKAFEGDPVEKFMVRDTVTVDPSISVDELIDTYIYRYHHKMFPVVDNGKLRGSVTIDRVKEVPGEKRNKVTAGDICTSADDNNTIDKNEDATNALSRMFKTQNTRLMVVENGMDLAGIITLRDMLQFLSLNMDMEPQMKPLQASADIKT